MTEEDLRTRIRDSYRFCLFLISTEILEGIAILVTLLVHAGLSQVLDTLPLSGTQKIVAVVFKVVLFAVPFFAIVVHVIRDFRRVLSALDHEHGEHRNLRGSTNHPGRPASPHYGMGWRPTVNNRLRAGSLRQNRGDSRATTPYHRRLRCPQRRKSTVN